MTGMLCCWPRTSAMSLDEYEERETVEKAVEAFRRGECVLVMDDKERENECDIFLHGEYCSESKMAFMIRNTTGIICVVADKERLEKFGLYPAVHGNNTDKNATNFYVSTDYLPETTTGVSAKDRAATIKAMVNLLRDPAQFSKPGHVFPLCARPGGLLEREGHTEAAYDLCRLGEMPTVAAIGELMNADGRMLNFEESQRFAHEHGLVLVTVEQLKQAIKQKFGKEEEEDEPSGKYCRVPSRYVEETRVGVFKCRGGVEVVAMVKGEVRKKKEVAMRVHSECLTGDVLGSRRCDCGEQLVGFMEGVLDKKECGVLLYIRGQEGRGMGLANKLKAYAIQDELKLDTIDANLHVGFHTDTRDYAEIVEIIREKLEIESIILYSNNPEKQTSLGPVVAKVEALAFKANEHNKKYLETKKERMRHKTVMDTMQWDKEAVEAKTGEGEKKRVCVIAARWNADFVEPLLNECMAELEEKKAEVSMYRVPGALDLLAAARTVLKKKDTKVDAIVLIGVLIKGESDGYSAACNSLATGISQLNSSSEFNVPVISGLLMCQDEGQAEERCADHKLGAGFALEALEMVTLTKSL